MKVFAALILCSLITCSGCVCMFVPCDKWVHVSGHVFDEKHNPLQDADVEFYGDIKKTDANGCFYFGGVLAASGFNISVSKPGFKSYTEGKEFDYYDIDVSLPSQESVDNSS